MSLKWIGAAMVVCGCGGCGFAMAASKRMEERELRQILRGIEYIECELQFRGTSLAELFRNAAAVLSEPMHKVFLKFASELDKQTAADPGMCVGEVLRQETGLTEGTREILRQLGSTLGCFDLAGQLKGLESVSLSCKERIGELTQNREIRLRSYQTLGLCTGAALAILFL